MTIRKVEVERVTITSSKRFEVVVAALEASVGHPDMVEFMKAVTGARTFSELESETRHLTLLSQFWWMSGPTAHLTYDRMASLLAPYRNPDALAIARDLDSKIESLLRQIA